MEEQRTLMLPFFVIARHGGNVEVFGDMGLVLHMRNSGGSYTPELGLY